MKGWGGGGCCSAQLIQWVQWLRKCPLDTAHCPALPPPFFSPGPLAAPGRADSSSHPHPLSCPSSAGAIGHGMQAGQGFGPVQDRAREEGSKPALHNTKCNSLATPSYCLHCTTTWAVQGRFSRQPSRSRAMAVDERQTLISLAPEERWSSDDKGPDQTFAEHMGGGIIWEG